MRAGAGAAAPPPEELDTHTDDRCPLLMSRTYDRSTTSLADRLKDAARLKEDTAARPGSALRDMIANLHAQNDKDSFWGDGGVKAAASGGGAGGGGGQAKQQRQRRLAPLQDRRLASFAVHDANHHLARSWRTSSQARCL